MTGSVVHFEIPVDDPERAVAFYRTALGWSLERWGPIEYWTTEPSDGVGIGGALSRRDVSSPTLIVYVGVEDVDVALAAIEAAGGRRLSDRMPIPGVGWTAVFEDTEGNRVGLFQDDPTTPVPDLPPDLE